MTETLLDANVLLRHLVGDVPDHARAANTLMARVETGEEQVELVELALFEVIFTLERTYRISKHEVRETLGQILRLPGTHVASRELLLDSLDLHADLNLRFVDAYMATIARRDNVNVISFDKEFDRVPGVTRVEPGA